MAYFLGEKYSGFNSLAISIKHLRDGVSEAIDEYKWVRSQQSGYDIGWKNAANKWFKHEFSEWLSGIVDSEAFEKLILRGKSWDSDTARLFRAIGQARVRSLPGENVKIWEEFSKAQFWGELPQDICSILENGMPGDVIALPRKEIEWSSGALDRSG
jgi:hypothetical protein